MATGKAEADTPTPHSFIVQDADPGVTELFVPEGEPDAWGAFGDFWGAFNPFMASIAALRG
ncbi:hypothetical protein ACIREO_38050 [Streptomyces sp. NPDC102441]|uniref:hypothetical protein n=1 Tax=Streptomyces sp. NPDC102441 TaxID=3366176 RepID=UPI003829FC8E